MINQCERKGFAKHQPPTIVTPLSFYLLQQSSTFIPITSIIIISHSLLNFKCISVHIHHIAADGRNL